MIMISDIDEIPNPKRIKDFDSNYNYGCFMQMNFQSKINLLNMDLKSWPGTKICKKRNLKSPQWLRNIKIKKRPFWKFYKPKQPQLIYDGGWHFSFLKSPENISLKIKSYVHQEHNKEKFTNIENIKKRIYDKEDILEEILIISQLKLTTHFQAIFLVIKKDLKIGSFKNWCARKESNLNLLIRSQTLYPVELQAHMIIINLK